MRQLCPIIPLMFAWTLSKSPHLPWPAWLTGNWAVREREHKKETKLIKIAVSDDYLLGLTNKGHVHKLDGLEDGGSMLTWHYVSKSTSILTCSQLEYTATKVLWFRMGKGTPRLPYKHRGWWLEITTSRGTTIRYHAHNPFFFHVNFYCAEVLSTYITHYCTFRFGEIEGGVRKVFKSLPRAVNPKLSNCHRSLLPPHIHFSW